MSDIILTTSEPTAKTVGDPCTQYESMRTIWKRARAILNGQAQAKAYDAVLDNISYSNLLLPFSPTMSVEQYRFLVAEAELPGLVGQYAKVLVGGLLRKKPIIQVGNPEKETLTPNESDAKEWFEDKVTSTGGSMVSFLDAALWEELQSGRAWVIVDYPAVPADTENKDLTPYAFVVSAENIINWRVASSNGENKLVALTLRNFEEEVPDGEFHPRLIDTVTHYYLNKSGSLEIQKYRREAEASQIATVAGAIQSEYQQNKVKWIPHGQLIVPMIQGNTFDEIPAFPLNGNLNCEEPLLQPLIDREIALYNKVTRRNHLLYGASTFTPVVCSDMGDDKFRDIVGGGLGSWIHVGEKDSVTTLDTPTDALKDMDRAITDTIGEMSRMGIRMLAPEGSSGESGVSLDIRNAGQTAQLGLLNNKVSKTMEKVLALMYKWRYGEETHIKFQLTADFNPVPMGADWLRLVGEWYQAGIIPRSVFLEVSKQNDVIPSDYNDDEGMAEIQKDPIVQNKATAIDSSIITQ